ncbi:MAG: ERF family protein [Eubacteriaceae bacterium]
MIEHSESIKELATALCKFHSEVGKVKKENTNPFFKSKYADLSSILDVIEEPLHKNGLSFVQFPIGEHEMLTMLMHISGEWIKGSYIMKPTKNDPQGLGSVITYQRRYALGSILGLNIDEDDDGNEASKPQPKTEKQWINPGSESWNKALSQKATIETVKQYYKISKDNEVKYLEELSNGSN